MNKHVNQLDRENTAKMAKIGTLKILTSHGNFCHFSVAVLIFDLKLYPRCKKFEDYHRPRVSSFFAILIFIPEPDS